MKDFEKDESFLARWLENKLTKEELKQFESDEDFALFDKINKETSGFKVKKANVNEDYIKVKSKLSSKGKVVNFNKWYAIAASVIIILGLFQFMNSSKTINANFEEKILVELPDGSKIHLNAGSEISYKRFFWIDNKIINLKGEAYFEVVKSTNGFKVISKSGEVNVLGTKFNVIDRKYRFDVVCYSGKVSVSPIKSSENFILEKGDKVKIVNNLSYSSKIVDDIPNWLNNFSVFKDEPLKTVITSLERQYNITIKIGSVDTSKLFTGSFVHNNLASALKTTLPVMGISYQVSKDRKVITLR